MDLSRRPLKGLCLMGTKQQEHTNHSALTNWFWTDLYSPELNFNDMLEQFSKVSAVIQLQDQINYHFKSLTYLLNAFSHRSFINEVKAIKLESYESLEFLGDSYLNYFVSKNLKNKLPHLPEGQLSKLRGAIVNTTSLHDIAVFLELPSFLLTGRGQVTHQETLKHKIYADLLEAIVGAIICDASESEAWNFLDKVFKEYQSENKVNFWEENLLMNFDFKSQLQEVVMRELKITPIYDSVESNQVFNITCRIGDQIIGSLEHNSKKLGKKN